MVNRFVEETREIMNQEALERAKQAAWEQRMLDSITLNPVRVRVDARMRPDR